MSWTAVLVVCFLVTQAAAMAMLTTSGLYSELFGRHRRIARAQDSSAQLRQAARGENEFIENHEFWDLAEPEEVAF